MAWLGKVPAQRAEAMAERLLHEYGVEEPAHIRLEDIAWDQGMKVHLGGLQGAAARLTVLGDEAVIRVVGQDVEAPHVRFGIAHEMGHFIVQRERLRAFCTPDDLRTWDEKKKLEAQANYFAACLLMPRFLMEPELGRRPITADRIGRVADRYGTSRRAAAIRGVKVSRRPCAVACCEDGRVRWVARGDAFPFVRGGGRVSRLSLASTITGPGRTTTGPEVVSCHAWIDDDEEVRGELVEELLDVGHGKTLSILTIE
jgi:hypothetical protein